MIKWLWKNVHLIVLVDRKLGWQQFKLLCQQQFTCSKCQDKYVNEVLIINCILLSLCHRHANWFTRKPIKVRTNIERTTSENRHNRAELPFTTWVDGVGKGGGWWWWARNLVICELLCVYAWKDPICVSLEQLVTSHVIHRRDATR